MRNTIIVLVIGFLLGFSVAVMADAGDRPIEHIFNRVWNTTNNTLNIKGI